jgi:hypothetical protein
MIELSNWTINKITFSEKIPCISRTIQHDIFSMEIYGQTLLVFFKEGDYYSCLDLETLENCLLLQPTRESQLDTLMLDSNHQTTHHHSSGGDIWQSSVHPDFTNVSTSEFLKMLQQQQLQVQSQMGCIEFQKNDEDMVLHQARKRRPSSETTIEPSVAMKHHKRARSLLPEPIYYVLDPNDDGNHHHQGLLLGYSFTYGHYGCVTWNTKGVLTYLHLTHDYHIKQASVKSMLQDYYWKLCMNADTSDVLMTFLKYHEKIPDKPIFYQHMMTEIASICSQKTVSIDVNILNALGMLLL